MFKTNKTKQKNTIIKIQNIKFEFIFFVENTSLAHDKALILLTFLILISSILNE